MAVADLLRRIRGKIRWLGYKLGNGPAIEIAGLQPLAVSAMQYRRQAPLAKRGRNGANYEAASPEKFEVQLEKMRQLEPRAFPIWFECFYSGSREYDRTKNSSCSVWGHRYAEAFRDFCAFHLRGRVLDIGCGAYGKPVYLAGYPSAFISAVEPHPLKESVDFEVVRGFAEFLPWSDKSFDIVIAATSLDHVLSLEKTLDEITRVLADDGSFLLWTGVVPGAPPYDPKNPVAVDAFHLFHFDEDWLNPLLLKHFTIDEKLSLSHNLFYALSKSTNTASR